MRVVFYCCSMGSLPSSGILVALTRTVVHNMNFTILSDSSSTQVQDGVEQVLADTDALSP